MTAVPTHPDSDYIEERAVTADPSSAPRQEVAGQEVEVVFSLFPGTFVSGTVQEGEEGGANDRILLFLVVLSVVCVAVAAFIAQ